MRFQRQLIGAYSASLVITIATGAIAMFAFRAIGTNDERVAHQYADELLEVEQLRFQAERVVASSRGYFLMRDPGYLARMTAAASKLDARALDLNDATLASASTTDLAAIVDDAHAYAEDARSIAHEDPPDVAVSFERMLQSQRASLEQHLDSLAQRERASFEAAIARTRKHAGRTAVLVGVATALGLILSLLLATVVMRRLFRQFSESRKEVDDTRRAATAHVVTLAVASHDLRGPMSTILMASDLLRDTHARPALNPRRHAESIHRAAKRMQYLVEQIVDVTQLDAGMLRLSFEDCDVASVLDAASGMFATRAKATAISLRMTPPMVQTFVVADRKRLLRILANLIENALERTPAGGVVDVKAEVVRMALQFSVEDTGPRMTADHLEQLFDQQWQWESGGDRRSVGLGLYVSKKLVEAHHGRIWAEAIAGGTRSLFSLPLVTPDLHSLEPLPS